MINGFTYDNIQVHKLLLKCIKYIKTLDNKLFE